MNDQIPRPSGPPDNDPDTRDGLARGDGLPSGTLAVPSPPFLPDDSGPELLVLPTEQGPVILAWTTLQGLVTELGPRQTWLALAPADLAAVAEQAGATVLVDGHQPDADAPPAVP